MLKPSNDLRNKIIRNIVKNEYKRAKKYLLLSLITASASFVGLFFSVKYALNSFYQSSFYDYFSLIFSDRDMVLSNWKEFSLSLMESLPYFSVTLVLVAIGLFMYSMLIYANTTKRDFSFSLEH